MQGFSERPKRTYKDRKVSSMIGWKQVERTSPMPTGMFQCGQQTVGWQSLLTGTAGQAAPGSGDTMASSLVSLS